MPRGKHPKRTPKLTSGIVNTLEYLESLSGGNGSKAQASTATAEPPSAPPEAPAIPPTVKRYRGFDPMPMPADYAYQTPSWYYSSLVWDERVQELKPKPANNLREKLQMWSTVAVLIVFAIVMFLTFVIVMD